MRKKKVVGPFILSSIILVSLLGGCKKYDEGPFVSLRSKQARLTGEWSLTSQSVNETDIPLVSWDNITIDFECFQEGPGWKEFSESIELESVNGETWTVLKNGEMDVFTLNTRQELVSSTVADCENEIVELETRVVDFSTVRRRSWAFSSKKENLLVVNNANQDTIEYRILKLTNSELKVEALIDGPLKIFEFEKQE